MSFLGLLLTRNFNNTKNLKDVGYFFVGYL